MITLWFSFTYKFQQISLQIFWYYKMIGIARHKNHTGKSINKFSNFVNKCLSHLIKEVNSKTSTEWMFTNSFFETVLLELVFMFQICYYLISFIFAITVSGTWGGTSLLSIVTFPWGMWVCFNLVVYVSLEWYL